MPEKVSYKKPRQRYRKRRKDRGQGGGGPKQWQCPQTKVVLRNIQLESAAQVVEAISTLISRTNQDQKYLPIRLDQDSSQKILQEQEAIAASKRDTSEGLETTTQEAPGQGESMDVDTLPCRDAQDEQKPPEKSMADIVMGEVKDDPSGQVVSARLLYLVMPKTSRRRGEKPGCAYLVLTAPEPPSPDTVTAQTKDAPTEAKKEHAEGDVSTKGDDAHGGDKGAVKTPQTEEGDTAQTESHFQHSPAQRTRLMALSRLQLLQAVEALTSQTKQDTKQPYSQWQVGQSLSAKAWRPSRPDKREGTVENTPHYKNFIIKQAKDIEERQSRPKPAVGGGTSILSKPATDSSAADEDQPLAAIVLHLRSKRRQEKQKKQQKKKKSPQATSKSKSQSRGSSAKSGSTKSRQKKKKAPQATSKSKPQARGGGAKSGGSKS